MKTIFEKERNTTLTEEEFEILILSYPIFLVANADNEFDSDEKKMMSIILENFLIGIYKDSISNQDLNFLIENYIEDFQFLSLNEGTYKLDFLKLLKDYNPEVKESIKSLMLEVAEVSKGASDTEMNMISFVNQFL